MTDDPRDILKAAGVECAELDEYEQLARLDPERVDPDAAILALARLAANERGFTEFCLTKGMVPTRQARVMWDRR